MPNMSEDQIIAVAYALLYTSPNDMHQRLEQKGFTSGDAYLLVKAGELYLSWLKNAENDPTFDDDHM